MEYAILYWLNINQNEQIRDKKLYVQLYGKYRSRLKRFTQRLNYMQLQ